MALELWALMNVLGTLRLDKTMPSCFSCSYTIMVKIYVAITRTSRQTYSALSICLQKLYVNWSNPYVEPGRSCGPITPACHIQINAHQSLTLLQDTPKNVLCRMNIMCVYVCVCMCEIMTILWCPWVIWFKLGTLFPVWPPVTTKKEGTLTVCTYCINNGVVLEIPSSSHLHLFQPDMQASLSSAFAIFHRSVQLPRSSNPCRHFSPVEEAELSAAVCSMLFTLTETLGMSWWVFM